MKKMIMGSMGYSDFVYVSGDAYVDHPSFGAIIPKKVVISRISGVYAVAA